MRQITSQQFAVPAYDEDELAPVIKKPDVIASSDVNGTPHDDFLLRTLPDSSKRNRMQFRWALDLRKRCEFDIAFWLEDLKVSRQFTTVMRNAIRLYRDFEAGEYNVLRELFPNVVKKIVDDARPASEDFNRLLAELADLKCQQMIGQGAASQPGPRAMSIPAIPGPAAAPDDDVALVVTKAKGSGGASALNFLASVNNLQQ